MTDAPSRQTRAERYKRYKRLDERLARALAEAKDKERKAAAVPEKGNPDVVVS